MVNIFEKITKQNSFIQLHPNSKIPLASDWVNNGKPFSEVCLQNGNVGLLTGEVSGLLDIDLDCREAVALADVILPAPHIQFGRTTCDSGHFLYKALSFGPTKRFSSTEGDVLIELRGNNSQTMIPPSKHDCGEQLTINDSNLDLEPQHYDHLHRCVSFVAAAAEIAKNWRKGVRHNLALAFSGYCLKQGVSTELLETIFDRITTLKGDEEAEDRLKTLYTSAAKPTEQLEGYKGLERILGTDKANRIADWVGTYLGKVSSRSPSVRSVYPSDIVNYGQFSDLARQTEGDLGNEFGRWLDRKARFVVERKEWFLWNGVTWVPDYANHILQLAISFVDDAKAELINGLKYQTAQELDKFKSVNRLENLIKVAASQRATHSTAFDQSPMVVATREHYLSLETGEIFAPNPDMLISKTLNVSYDANASCPTFERFICDVFEGDRDLMHFVKKVVGYSLTGHTSEQAMFILIGDGANGKSTFINLLNSLWGDYGTTAASQMLVAGSSSLGDDLVDLIGARLISVNETEEGQSLAEAKVKQMTGGDYLKGRPLYGKWIEFKIIGKLFLATNSLPQINNSDHGIWRRINTIPFNRTFRPDEQDRDLAQKLQAEMPGILNWAIEGCLAWQKERLNPPKSVLDEVAEYKDAMDTVAQFVNDECDLAQDAKSSASSLYLDYQRFCGTLGKRPKTNIHFKKQLLKVDGVEQRKTSSGNMWLGIKSAGTPLI